MSVDMLEGGQLLLPCSPQLWPLMAKLPCSGTRRCSGALCPTISGRELMVISRFTLQQMAFYHQVHMNLPQSSIPSPFRRFWKSILIKSSNGCPYTAHVPSSRNSGNRNLWTKFLWSLFITSQHKSWFFRLSISTGFINFEFIPAQTFGVLIRLGELDGSLCDNIILPSVKATKP